MPFQLKLSMLLVLRSQLRPSSSHFTGNTLDVPPTGHADGLTRNVAEQRARDSQHRGRRLCRRARSAQRDIRVRGLGAAAGASRLLSGGNAEGDLGAVGQDGFRAGLLGGGQAREDVAEGDGVCAHAEGGAPLLRDGFGQAHHARLRQRVVGLARVAVQPARRRDVDDVARLAVLDAEVGRRRADQLERRAAVQVDDRVPLLVGCAVDHSVPREACVVHDDVDLAVAELCRLLDQLVDVGVDEDVAGHGDCAAARFVDLARYVIGFLCSCL